MDKRQLLKIDAKSFRRDKMMFGKISKLFFVGVGGAGMSGIAEVLFNLGFDVRGSDQTPGEITDYLTRMGMTICQGHAADNVAGSDVVIISSAISEDNPEVVEAGRLGIPVIKRAEMLGELMRLKYSIGIAGTHGKTTTTSMIGMILKQARLDPTIIVGGIVSELGTGAALGSGEYLVAEADEYDRSFLAMFPTISVVTNIEADHLDCYRDMDDLLHCFRDFINRVPFYGAAIISGDDPNVMSLRDGLSRPFKTFGFSHECDYVASGITLEAGRSVFSVSRCGDPMGEIILHVPGRFNIANALAAIATATEIEVSFETIADALRNFKGVGRRFELIGEVNNIMVVDDYAHHPTEVRATLEMARDAYKRRTIVVFQPHLYSRTREFARQFAEALSLADVCILTDIYPAREEPIKGVTSELIMEYAAKSGRTDFEYVGTKDKAPARVIEHAVPGDLIITMGAGSITHIRKTILEGLKK